MQTANLQRVRAAIGPLVVQFITDRWKLNARYFTAADLRAYIQARTNTAPASPDRILRQLRAEGKFDYRVVNRRQSEYEILGLAGSPSERRKVAKLLYRSTVIDSFEITGRRFKLPMHVINHFHASNDFELQL